jgi:hypothetical protein
MTPGRSLTRSAIIGPHDAQDFAIVFVGILKDRAGPLCRRAPGRATHGLRKAGATIAAENGAALAQQYPAGIAGGFSNLIWECRTRARRLTAMPRRRHHNEAERLDRGLPFRAGHRTDRTDTDKSIMTAAAAA